MPIPCKHWLEKGSCKRFHTDYRQNQCGYIHDFEIAAMGMKNISLCRMDGDGIWAPVEIERLCLLVKSKKPYKCKKKIAKKLLEVIAHNAKIVKALRNDLEREACYVAFTDLLSSLDSCWIPKRCPYIFDDMVSILQGVINILGESVDMLEERKSRIESINKNLMLDRHIERLCKKLIPSREDLERRQNVLKMLVEFIESHNIPGLSMMTYGSTVSGFLTSESDFDITLSTSESSMSANVILQNLHNSISKSNLFHEIHFIKNAKIPILKFSHKETNLEFDICADNPLPQYNTELLLTYSKCDPRVNVMIVLVKTWAKRKGIGSSSTGHLSSYSWSLMVIFFLQVAKVLPVLTSPELAELDRSGKDARFCRDVEAANKSLLAKDTRSVGELLRDFFTFYAWQFNRSNNCICVRSGTLKSFKAKRRRSGREDWFVILDPFESNQNQFIPNNVQDTRRVARDLGSTVISVCVFFL